jgi:D-alanine transaminase
VIHLIFYNGQFLEDNEAHISHKDRGYYFGDGVYEVFRVYNGKLYAKESHLQRLERSAAAIRLSLPYAEDEIASKLEQLIALENLQEGTVYIQITRGIAPRAHSFPGNAEPIVLAFCNAVKRPVPLMRDGISAVTQPDIRWLRCDIKSLNLLPNVLAKQHAAERQAGEAILHRDGVVTECSASNVMIVKDGVIRTHPADHHILHGITRAVTIRLAAKLGITLSEERFSLDELMRADEVFITGTTVEITPVIQVDGEPVADGRPGPITKRLQAAFEQTI